MLRSDDLVDSDGNAYSFLVCVSLKAYNRPPGGGVANTRQEIRIVPKVISSNSYSLSSTGKHWRVNLFSGVLVAVTVGDGAGAGVSVGKTAVAVGAGVLVGVGVGAAQAASAKIRNRLGRSL